MKEKDLIKQALQENVIDFEKAKNDIINNAIHKSAGKPMRMMWGAMAAMCVLFVLLFSYQLHLLQKASKNNKSMMVVSEERSSDASAEKAMMESPKMAEVEMAQGTEGSAESADAMSVQESAQDAKEVSKETAKQEVQVTEKKSARQENAFGFNDVSEIGKKTNDSDIKVKEVEFWDNPELLLPEQFYVPAGIDNWHFFEYYTNSDKEPNYDTLKNYIMVGQSEDKSQRLTIGISFEGRDLSGILAVDAEEYQSTKIQNVEMKLIAWNDELYTVFEKGGVMYSVTAKGMERSNYIAVIDSILSVK